VNRERPTHLQLVVGEEPRPDPNVGRVEVTASIDWTRTEDGRLQPYMSVNWLDDAAPEPEWFHDEFAALGRSVLDSERGTQTFAAFHLHVLADRTWRAGWHVLDDGPEEYVGEDPTGRIRMIEAYLAHAAVKGQADEAIARMFHEEYERLAPEHGYETRRDSAVPWEDVPERNRRLMVATVAAVLERLGVQRTGAPGYADGREGS
jgi:hypothetical protein